jgi:hypothetical protein
VLLSVVDEDGVLVGTISITDLKCCGVNGECFSRSSVQILCLRNPSIYVKDLKIWYTVCVYFSYCFRLFKSIGEYKRLMAGRFLMQL